MKKLRTPENPPLSQALRLIELQFVTVLIELAHRDGAVEASRR